MYFSDLKQCLLKDIKHSLKAVYCPLLRFACFPSRCINSKLVKSKLMRFYSHLLLECVEQFDNSRVNLNWGNKSGMIYGTTYEPWISLSNKC